MKPEHKIFRRISGASRHVLALIISISVSLIVPLVRLIVGHPLHSPVRDLLTFGLFLFAVLELILQTAEPKSRRNLMRSILRLYRKEPASPQRISHKVLLAVLAVCGITLYCVHTTYCFDRTTESLDAQKEVALISGEVLEQELLDFENSPDLALSAVRIRFGTNEQNILQGDSLTRARTAESIVHVSLIENEDVIQTWDLPFYLFSEKGYRKLELDSVLKLRADARYFLRIVEEYGEGAQSGSGDAEESGSGDSYEEDYEENSAEGYEEDYEEDYEENSSEGYEEDSMRLSAEKTGTEEEVPISLYVYANGGDGYVRDGIPHQCTLCYTLTYRNLALKSRFTRNGILLGILAAVLLLLDLEETAVMTAFLGILMLLFMQICPPFMAPDEENHFKRAFEVAKVSYISKHIGETGVGGNALPAAIDDYVGLYIDKTEEMAEEASGLPEEEIPEEEEQEVFLSPAALPLKELPEAASVESVSPEGDSGSYEDSPEMEEQADASADETDNGSGLEEQERAPILLDWNETKEMEFGNTALYSPVSYLPHSAGIRIANVFSDQVPSLYYGGRWGNLIANFLLCAFALRLMPFGKRILFLIMTFPMTLQEMVTLTPDGFTISVCFFFFACVLHLSYGKREINRADMAVLGTAAVVLSQLKIVYVILLLLLFMIPEKRFASRRTALLFKGIAVGLALVLNLLWLRTSSGFLVEFQPGVDTPAQIRYVMSHIPAFYEVCARSFVNSVSRWISTMIGSVLGAYQFSTTPTIWVSALILFVYETAASRENRQDVHLWDPLVLILGFLGGCALILASLYVQWTPYRDTVIQGIQGRYFTPLLPLLAFFAVFMLQKRRKQQGFAAETDAVVQRGSYCYLILLLYNGIALLDIVNYFLVELW